MRSPSQTAGFSLIELITVVLIIGIVAGVAVPKVLSHSEEASIEATCQHFKTMALALEMYYNEAGDWPNDSAAGAMPTGLDAFLRPNLFAVDCPLGGGSYDWDKDRHDVVAAIKIVSPKPSSEQMLAIDELLDDGNLATGSVIEVAGFKLILEQ